jgi:hypothetical protein
VAAVFAHVAMRPLGAAVLMKLARLSPALLTQGARWGGKVRIAELADATALAPARSAASPHAPQFP